MVLGLVRNDHIDVPQVNSAVMGQHSSPRVRQFSSDRLRPRPFSPIINAITRSSRAVTSINRQRDARFNTAFKLSTHRVLEILITHRLVK
ncbi:hypothetical protein AVEN_123653-1 [Araneus ventricosus]|uniref:Uncharacterized protein n=1 Tax=Araneus ventricosus TaxID=182803 RepID=A0A4Y2L6F0_ARAVE|nr:hypothetical protein AVEN_123653-1 [Araneus ventricosus]